LHELLTFLAAQISGWFDRTRSKIPKNSGSASERDEEAILSKEEFKGEADDEMLLSPARSREHSKEVTAVLNTWLQVHTEDSYPSKTDKQQLSTDTGLNISKIGILVS